MKTFELNRSARQRTGVSKLKARGAAATLAALVLAALPAEAGNGTWTGNGNQTYGQSIWGGTGNWVSSQVADGTSYTATFGNSFTKGYNVIVNTDRTIGHIVFTDPANANDLSLSKDTSDHILTLDVTNGAPAAPTINVTQAGRTLVIYPRVRGSDGLAKSGPGTLTLSNANLYTGATVIQAGTLTLAHSQALQSNVLDTANSILGDTSNGLRTTVSSLTLGGLSGNKDFASVFTTTAGGYGTVTDLTLNPGSGVSASYSGLIADGTAGMTLTKSGNGTQTLGAVNAYTGATTVNAGTLKFQAAATASAHTAVTVVGGATLGVLVTSNNGQWVNTGDLTQQDASTLVIDYGSSVPSTSTAPLKVANLSLGAGLTLQVTATSFAGFVANQSYPLITWSGSGPADASAFSTLVLARRVVGNLSVVGKTLFLNMTANAPGPLNWNTGNGTWDTVTANWLDGASAPTTYEDLLDSVVLDDAAGVTGNPTVTMATALSPVNLTMNSSNHDYTLTGAGGLAGTTSLTLDAANTRTLTLGTANTHSGANTINGGTLVLSGNNTYTGPTIVNAGTLRLGANNVIPDGAGVANVTVNAGGTFDLNGLSETINGLTGSGTVDTLAGGTATLTVGTNNTSSTFSGSIRNTAGTLNLAKTGTGTFTLAGTNTFSGTVSIQAGTLALGGPDALDGATGITMADGAALTPTLSNLVVNAPITLGDVGTSSRIDTPTVSVGTTFLPFTLNGPISGAGNLTLNGTISLNTYGTIILNAQSTYTGSTLITCNPNSNAGVNCFVKLGTNNALPPTTVLTLDGLDGGGSGRTVQLDLNGFSQTLAGLQNAARAANRRQQIANTSATTGNLTVNSTNSTDYWYFTGDFGTPSAGNFSLTKNGSGFLYLAGTVAYSGNTTVNGGTVDFVQPNLMASTSTVSIASGGALQLDFVGTNRVGALVLNGVNQAPGVYNSANAAPFISGIGNLIVYPAGPLTWNTGNGTWDTVTANWLDYASAPAIYKDLLDSVLFGDAPGVTGNPTVTMASAFSPLNMTMNSTNHDYTVTGADGLAGTASLTLDAANTRTLTLATANTHSGTNTINGGTLVLSGNNAYTGPTIVNAGTLRLGANNVIPDGSGMANVTVNPGGTFDLNGLSETINGLTGSGTVDTLAGGTATLTVGANNTSSTFSGSIRNTAGTLNLAKTGTGTFTLSGTNTFSGTVSIQTGALGLGGTDALDGAARITIAGDAALTPTLSNLVVNAPITLGDAGTSSRIDTPTVNVGTTYLPFTLNGPISGAGNLTLNGTISLNTYGTIILNAQSTYTGSTLITCNPNSNAGVNCFVKLGTNNALPPTTVLTLDGLDGGGSGRTVQFDLNGFNQALAGFVNTPRASIRRQQIVNTSATPGNLTVNSTNSSDYWYFTGDFGTASAGNLSVTKNGSGLLYLAGTVAYSGNTTVNGGTLAITLPNLMATNSMVSIASNAVLQLDFSATNRVGALVLGGTKQADGIYNSVNAAPYITGSGSIQVVTPVIVVPPQPTIAPVTVSGTNLVVSVPTVSGFNYVLQSTTNLTPTILWQNESTNAGTGSSLILNVPVEPGKPSKFLRFKVY